MQEERSDSRFFTSSQLHAVGMALMLADHTWHTLLPSYIWLTAVGRIAFPIFAFLAAEGYVHTSDARRYIRRMLVFALVSEVPFDLMVWGGPFYPFHQNVMWTFFLALGGLYLADKVSARPAGQGSAALTAAARILILTGAVILGFACFTDYYGAGVLLVYVFYFCRGTDLLHRAGQFLGMYYINVEMLGGYMVELSLFGMQAEVILQAFGMFALVPIWLYNGRKGSRSKAYQYFCYAFYPAHMLVLYLLARFAF